MSSQGFYYDTEGNVYYCGQGDIRQDAYRYVDDNYINTFRTSNGFDNIERQYFKNRRNALRRSLRLVSNDNFFDRAS